MLLWFSGKIKALPNGLVIEVNDSVPASQFARISYVQSVEQPRPPTDSVTTLHQVVGYQEDVTPSACILESSFPPIFPFPPFFFRALLLRSPWWWLVLCSLFCVNPSGYSFENGISHPFYANKLDKKLYSFDISPKNGFWVSSIPESRRHPASFQGSWSTRGPSFCTVPSRTPRPESGATPPSFTNESPPQAGLLCLILFCRLLASPRHRTAGLRMVWNMAPRRSPTEVGKWMVCGHGCILRFLGIANPAAQHGLNCLTPKCQRGSCTVSPQRSGMQGKTMVSTEGWEH